MSHLLLIGFMGAGKSTVGRLLASHLEVPFVDLDAEIERAAGGRPVSEIFSAEGEAVFRAMESAALAALEGAPASVVACGGGVVLDDENRRVLKSLGTVVYLKVSAAEALARIGDVAGRPLLERGDATAMAATLLTARETLYRSTADLTIDTAGLSAEAVAERVLAAVGDGEAAQDGAS